MSSDTFATVAAVPHIPEPADALAVVMVLGSALGTLLAAFRLSAHPVPRAVTADLLGRVVGLTAHEAARAPGLSRRRIVLPQAMRSIVPPGGSEHAR